MQINFINIVKCPTPPLEMNINRMQIKKGFWFLQFARKFNFYINTLNILLTCTYTKRAFEAFVKNANKNRNINDFISTFKYQK